MTKCYICDSTIKESNKCQDGGMENICKHCKHDIDRENELEEYNNNLSNFYD